MYDEHRGGTCSSRGMEAENQLSSRTQKRSGRGPYPASQCQPWNLLVLEAQSRCYTITSQTELACVTWLNIPILDLS